MTFLELPYIFTAALSYYWQIINPAKQSCQTNADNFYPCDFAESTYYLVIVWFIFDLDSQDFYTTLYGNTGINKQ